MLKSHCSNLSPCLHADFYIMIIYRIVIKKFAIIMIGDIQNIRTTLIITHYTVWLNGYHMIWFVNC